jgi:ribosome-binding ATPase
VPLDVGIVGLPGSGKTALFNALTHGAASQHEMKEHVGMATIADDRLDRLAVVESSAKITPATIRVVDVPGTGPALLGNLRRSDALLAVVRDDDDLENLKLELLVADRDHIEKRLERVRSQAKSGDPKLRQEAADVEELLEHVDGGGTVADWGRPQPPELEPLTTKPLVVVVNGARGIDLELEEELAQLDDEEAAAFREGARSALEEVVLRLKDALDLIAFFTIGDTEARAWTLRRGQTALDAAESIHTDIARGFIRCEVIDWQDLLDCGSRAEVSKRGLQRLEGKEYVVQDGDVINIRFNL